MKHRYGAKNSLTEGMASIKWHKDLGSKQRLNISDCSKRGLDEGYIDNKCLEWCYDVVA